MKHTSKAFWVSALLISLSAGCSDDDDGTSDSNDDVARDAGSDASIDASVRPDGSLDAGLDAARDANADAAAILTEAEVVGLAQTINNGEIMAGELAQTKGTSTAVREYAAMMVTMHSAANARAAQLGITPADSPPANQVETMAMNALTELQNTPQGAAFDAAYIGSQVVMHQAALSLFDSVLLPNATTPALRTELQRVRGEVVTHLQQAQALRTDGGT